MRAHLRAHPRKSWAATGAVYVEARPLSQLLKLLLVYSLHCVPRPVGVM